MKPDQIPSRQELSSILQRLPKEDLAEIIRSVLERGKDPTFWGDLDEHAVRERFENASEKDYEKITPRWDLSSEAYFTHSSLSPQYLEGGRHTWQLGRTS